VKGFLRDGDLIGDLSFGPTEFTRLGPDYMMTNGAFHVANLPGGRTINGQSTLIWRRDGTTWRIIHDHSS
jgi:ketosteroid isomerase-like protein